MGDDYAHMTGAELLVARQRLQDELEDFEEMAAFHSVNSPAHATATERAATAARVERMRSAIVSIDALLAAETAE